MAEKIYYTFHESPLGPLLLWGNGEHIYGLHMAEQKYAVEAKSDWCRDSTVFVDALAQLRAYFASELTSFDLPLRPAGTPFQQQVWRALRDIPFGGTQSYSDIAKKINAPKAVRAVGAANGKNPIGIIVPCHRVIGSSGKLTGYAGGLERKQWLLAHEKNGRREMRDVAASASG